MTTDDYRVDEEVAAHSEDADGDNVKDVILKNNRRINSVILVKEVLYYLRSQQNCIKVTSF